jgi:hypothetical protein
MYRAVKFNHRPPFDTAKIHHKAIKGMLATKLEAAELPRRKWLC